MYKKSLRSMPRSIKKQLVKRIDIFESISDIIPITQAECAFEEKEMVDILSQIKDLPSYWLVSSKINTNIFYIVFESYLTPECEHQYYELMAGSYSPYYGIY